MFEDQRRFHLQKFSVRDHETLLLFRQLSKQILHDRLIEKRVARDKGFLSSIDAELWLVGVLPFEFFLETGRSLLHVEVSLGGFSDS